MSDKTMTVVKAPGSGTDELQSATKKTWGNDHGNLFNAGKDDTKLNKKDRLMAMKRKMSANHKF